MKKGKFIVFEGGEGSGKTTVQHMVKEYLEQLGNEVIVTREPGGIKIAEDIRNIILDTNNKQMDGKTEALLFAAARRQHLIEKVIPAVNTGKIVLCDRFIDSSLAYQGYARGYGIEEIKKINIFAIEDMLPDISILFDVDPEIGLDRIAKNSLREVNRLDKEALDFHYKVREGYNTLLNNNNYMKRVDASQSLNDVFEKVKEMVLKVID